jgi:MoxR-like ATPase
MTQLDIQKAAWFTPTPRGWGLVLVHEGPPGRGKTRRIEGLARRCNFPCMTLGASKGENAYGEYAVPHQRPDGSWVVVRPASDWVAEFTPERGGVVFTDEITSQPQAIQAMQLELLLDGRLGSHLFDPRVRFTGACNPVDYAANGTETASALANRVGWMESKPPSNEEWTEYMLGRGAFSRYRDETPIDAIAEEARVLAAWPDAYAKAAALATTFVSTQVDERGHGWKNREPKASDPRAARAYPTDRSCEMATLAFASSLVHGLNDDDCEEFVKAFVGREFTTAFFTWMETSDTVDVPAVLDGKAGWKPDTRVDRVVVVLSTAVKIVSEPTCPNRAARATVLAGMLTAVGESMQDLVVPMVNRLVNAKVPPLAHSAYVPVLARVHKAMGTWRDVNRKS